MLVRARAKLLFLSPLLVIELTNCLPLPALASNETLDPEFRPRLVAPAAVSASPADTCSAAQLGESFGVSSMPYLAGDTDNDGLIELIFSVGSEPFTRFLEVASNGSYSEVHIGPNIVPYAAGDFDGDGKGELFGQRGNTLEVYESVDAESHPSVLTWQHVQATNIIGYGTAGDTDKDGSPELIQSINSLGASELVIFESTGDNAFAQKFSTSLDDLSGWKLIADLDGDGDLEVTLSTRDGHVYMFEAVGNDSWVSATEFSVRLYGALGVSGGQDTDGNGVPELFVGGDDGAGLQVTRVFESVCNDSLRHVGDLEFFDGYSGTSLNAIGDTDGDGDAEFLMKVFSRILVFDSVSQGSWSATCTLFAPDSHSRFRAVDANKNGRAEIYWSEIGSAFSNTLFLEHPGATTSVPDRSAEPLRLHVSPNPIRGIAQIGLHGAARPFGGHVLAYDVLGRLVQQDSWSSIQSRCDWVPRGLASGSYYVVLRDGDGKDLAHSRITVIR